MSRLLIISSEEYKNFFKEISERYNLDYSKSIQEAEKMIDKEEYKMVISTKYIDNSDLDGEDILRFSREKGIAITILTDSNPESKYRAFSVGAMFVNINNRECLEGIIENNINGGQPKSLKTVKS